MLAVILYSGQRTSVFQKELKKMENIVQGRVWSSPRL